MRSWPKIKQLTCLLLVLTATVIPLSFLPSAAATMTMFTVTPSQGNVGMNVTVSSNLTTTDGRYEIRFDDSIVAIGNASGIDVTTTFMVPETFGGEHTVWVVDVATGDNASSVFSVTTAYSLTIMVPESPQQLQEGDSATISANITGGDTSETYVANVTVVAPNNQSSAAMVNIVTSSLGTGSVTIVYPDNFSDDEIYLIGEYGVSFNDTLATGAFHVGLTNTTEYHRFQYVDVKAVYQPDETVNMTISGTNVHSSFNLTADAFGIVHSTDFTVPPNASIGSYTVSIVSTAVNATAKSPLDIQTFTVPGFAVDVIAKNLAGNPVQSVQVKASENGAVSNTATTNSTGEAVLILEIGPFTLDGYYLSQKVGTSDFQVTGSSTTDLVCNLTNIGIAVVAIADGDQLGIPEVSVILNSTSEEKSLKTDIAGNVVAYSMLPNNAYGLNLFRYDVSFNFTTIPSLLDGDGNPVPWVNVTFVCPSYSLHIQVTKRGGQSLEGVIVKVQEALGGLYNQDTTNAIGVVNFNSALGTYTVAVYDSSGLKLNETSVGLFHDENVSLVCSLYDLSVTIQVVDYFGQGLANMNVTLQKQDLSPLSKSTQSDGTATFDGIVGGDVQILVYIGDQIDPISAMEQKVEPSANGSVATVQIKLDRLVSLGGLLVDTSHFAVALLVIVTVMLVLALEIYRMRKTRHQTSGSQSLDMES